MNEVYVEGITEIRQKHERIVPCTQPFLRSRKCWSGVTTVLRARADSLTTAVHANRQAAQCRDPAQGYTPKHRIGAATVDWHPVEPHRNRAHYGQH